MLQGLYSAASGMEAQQTQLNAISNDLSNADTPGYQSVNVGFEDLLYSSGGVSSGSTVATGAGAQASIVGRDTTDGATTDTQRPLDVGIQGDGFFRVADGTPPGSPPYTATFTNPSYTRAGDFTTNSLGFLTTQTGMYVIGKNAVAAGTAPNVTYTAGTSDSYINVPPGSSGVAIGQDGSVSYVDANPSSSTYQQRVTAGYISMASFPNEAGLQRDGGSLWSQSASSGSAVVGTPNTGGFGQTLGGQLEMSNVDMATEFTNMIEAQRGYEANASAITTADQMLQTVVQMKQ